MPPASTQKLPFATASLPAIAGVVRQLPQDFVVEESALYEATGEGEHLFVYFEKTSLTTADAVQQIASRLGCAFGQCGWAGLKDKHAVTRQWASFFGAKADAALSLDLPNIRVLAAKAHPHKLRTGHLRSNFFRLRIRTAGPYLSAAQAILTELANHGAPNYFGEQRFGHDNLAQATKWMVAGGAAPRSRFKRKMLMSVIQAAAFNEYVADRLERDGLKKTIAGDLLRKEDTGGLFTTADLEDAQNRMDNWEISPTGPMFGTKMRWPAAEALQREEALAQRWGLTSDTLQRHRKYGEGTRRVLRIQPQNANVKLHPEERNDLLVEFALPTGSFATVILRELLKPTLAQD